ncbi:carbon starvation protein A [candidate division KSB1 bacterium]|nr:carbon starvation protein A [candidate division KSB1 bacterium]
MTSFLVLTVVILFVLAYRFYGRWLEKKWRINPDRPTPAHTERDDMDYVPTKRPVLFGHHFASIAGAAPIIGPIAASVFGWVPVLLWIVLAGIFFGSVHDFGALFTSIRHKGKNLSEVIGEKTNRRNRSLFAWFVWLTSLLVIAAFTSIVADSFVAMPSAATASTLFLFLAVAFGFVMRRFQLPLIPLTLVGILLMAGAIYIGIMFPMSLSKPVWMMIISGYIAIASIAPVWLLLQPRDYLNSFLLFSLIIGATIGVLFVNPVIHAPAFAGFKVNNMEIFPLLFVMVACGAISGYHSMFASTTTSKQVNNERDIRPIAIGGMLVESFLAVIALLVAAQLSTGSFQQLYQNGGPIAIFSTGLAGLLERIGLPNEASASFVVLAISSFALTSLDSVARVARSILQHTAENNSFFENVKISPLLRSKIGATLITVFLGCVAAFTKWQIIWPIFGCANQLIAALALIIVFIWLKRSNRTFKIIIFPMIFMFIVTSAALVRLTYTSFLEGSYILAVFSIALIILSLLFVLSSYKFIFASPKNRKKGGDRGKSIVY